MKNTRQQDLYDMFVSCSPVELESWYDSYRHGYPVCVAPLILAIAHYRKIDTSNWAKLYR